MADLKSRIAECTEAVANPRARLDYYLNQGKKVIGCFPVYVPEELIHASDMIPMGLWGAQAELKQAKKYLPPFVCSIMQSCMELGLRGTYKGISAVIIPALCDTFRCVTQDWRYGVTEIPVLPITFPHNRKNDACVDFLISEYESLLTRLSTITDKKMTDERLEKTIIIYNEHTALMSEFASLANDHLDVITPTVRHIIMKSAQFYEKSEHNEIMKDINEGLKALPVYQSKDKRVILSGITAEPDDFLKILEENHITVVGDDLAQESRQYRTPIPATGGSAIRRLAMQWMNREGCSVVHDPIKKRDDMLVKMAQDNKASGVIYCQMKFCDPEEYDYPLCAKALRAAGIPILQVEIDQQNTSYEQARTRIQTFAEML